MRRQVRPGAFDQHRHLVGHEARVGTRRAEHGQAAAVTRGGDEQECLFQLDDGLPDLTDAEVFSAAAQIRL